MRRTARFLTLVAALVVAAPALATTARLHALGGGDFLEDDRLAQRWYAALADYPDQASLETGHVRFPRKSGRDDARSGLGGAVHFAVGDAYGVAGLFVHDEGNDVDPADLLADDLGTSYALQWAGRLGRIQPAVMFRRSDEGQAATGLAWEQTRTTDLGLGLRWDAADGIYVDFAAEVRGYEEANARADSSGARDGDGLGLRTRAFIRLSPTTALVPVLELLTSDRPRSANDGSVVSELDGSLRRIGCGLNWYPDADHLLVVGADYLHGRTDTAPDPARSGLRHNAYGITAGVESRFRWWLTLRGSLRWTGYEETDAEAVSELAMSLGAAIQLPGWDLDLALGDRAPRPIGLAPTGLADDGDSWLTATLRHTF